MNERNLTQEIKASPAQIRYANTLFYGALIGFVIMLVTYSLYVFGILTPLIPLEELPKLWGQSAQAYREAGGIPQGWGWLALVSRGDMSNFIGIAFLASLTIVCFLQLAVNLAKTKQWIMMVIALLEVLVLCLAASGILVSGGH
ncbi:MAG: DUF1634 domain-containing protein [Desulfovibrio sp.]|nr:DUF1634 domain-containing protein [Desulfovibrio sp.]